MIHKPMPNHATNNEDETLMIKLYWSNANQSYCLTFKVTISSFFISIDAFGNYYIMWTLIKQIYTKEHQVNNMRLYKTHPN